MDKAQVKKPKLQLKYLLKIANELDKIKSQNILSRSYAFPVDKNNTIVATYNEDIDDFELTYKHKPIIKLM